LITPRAFSITSGRFAVVGCAPSRNVGGRAAGRRCDEPLGALKSGGRPGARGGASRAGVRRRSSTAAAATPCGAGPVVFFVDRPRESAAARAGPRCSSINFGTDRHALRDLLSTNTARLRPATVSTILREERRRCRRSGPSARPFGCRCVARFAARSHDALFDRAHRLQGRAREVRGTVTVVGVEFPCRWNQ